MFTSVHIGFNLFTSLHISLHIFTSLHISVRLSAPLYISLRLFMSIYISLHLCGETQSDSLMEEDTRARTIRPKTPIDRFSAARKDHMPGRIDAELSVACPRLT